MKKKVSKVLEEDFENILSKRIEWQEFNGKTVFITGATGFIGSLLIRTFNYLNNKKHIQTNLIAIVRDLGKAEDILGDCNVTFVQGDINNKINISFNIDYIFHCAANTKSKEMVETPVEVIEGIINGTQNVLKLAYEKNVKSMVYLSSMEIYGQTNPDLEYVKEVDLGYIDIKSTRSCYPLGKRMAENICFSYYEEYNVPVKIARLAQTFGAGILKSEMRVFSQFARSAINGENIILNTDGSSSGNYCYSADVISGLLLLLFKGENGEIYNISNEDTCMTISQMAELVANKIGNKLIAIEYDIPQNNAFGFAPKVKMKLSSEKLRNLGWKPQYGLEDMYKRTIDYMKDYR